jgi:phi13 family phage major tail protein
MANQDEYKSTVGLDSLYVALVTADSAAAYTAGTPQYLAPAAKASQKVTSSQETQYADDQPYDVLTAEGPTDIEMEITGLDPQTEALILGKTFDATTGRMYDYGGTPPDVALSFRSMKSNGKYRYYQYLKGKFSPPDEETETKGEKPSPKTLKLNFKAVPTIYKFTVSAGVTKTVKRVKGDEDTTNFSATNFFASVQVPAVAAVSALALSSSDPVGGATGVAINKVLTLTFNNALPAGAINNVELINSATGAVIAGTNSLDTTRKVMTVGHTAALTASSTVYRIVYGVVDIYGQALSGTVTFTTVP